MKAMKSSAPRCCTEWVEKLAAANIRYLVKQSFGVFMTNDRDQPMSDFMSPDGRCAASIADRGSQDYSRLQTASRHSV